MKNKVVYIYSKELNWDMFVVFSLEFSSFIIQKGPRSIKEYDILQDCRTIDWDVFVVFSLQFSSFIIQKSPRSTYKGIRYFARLQDFLKRSYISIKKNFYLPRIEEIMKKSVRINQYNVQNLTVPKLVQWMKFSNIFVWNIIIIL